MSRVVVLGNVAPKEVHTERSRVPSKRAKLTKTATGHHALHPNGLTRSETEVHFPDERRPSEALREIIDLFCGHDAENPELGYHSDAAPAWVAGDDAICRAVADEYDCPVGVPSNWRKPRVSPVAAEAIGVKVDED